MLFVASRSSTDNDEEADNVHRYDLNSPFGSIELSTYVRHNKSLILRL